MHCTTQKTSLCIAVFMACITCVFLPVMAQTPAPDQENQETLTELEKKMSQVISISFRDMPIDDVIRTFADLGKIDIVKSPQVTGEVTATITQVPLGEALDNILAAHGYGYITSESMIRIVPAAEVLAEKQKPVSKVYRITYADVMELAGALERFISPQGKISASPGTNNLIVTDTPDKILAIDDFITEIDRITSQILVEARIYDISSVDQLDLGVEWFSSRNTAYDPVTGRAVSGATDPSIRGAFDSTIGRTTKTSAGFLQFGMLTDSLDLDVVLTAKKDDISAKLLANPRILVLDNETANIKIVSELPFQELTQTDGGGNLGSTAFKDVGVELEVTPHITRDGMIRLKLHPKFSVQVDSVSLAIPTEGGAVLFPQPVVDTRETTTTALIGDNQTVVIGGLRKKDSTMEISKVPLLGDIPYLGALFTFKGEKAVNSELVVFITPRIVDEPQLSPAETRRLEHSDSELCTPQYPPSLVDRCDKKE